MKKKFLQLILLSTSWIGVQAQNVGVTRIGSPQSGCNLGAETVRVDVFNYGTNITFATFDVAYRLDDNTAVSQTQVFTSFNANATQTVTFTIPVNFSGKYGKHTFTAYTSLSNDVDRSNDTMTVVIFNDAPSVGGTLFGHDTLCQSNNLDSLFLTGKTGDISQWEVNKGAGWVPIVHTDTFYEIKNLRETSSYRVLVKNGRCAATYSNEVAVTIQTPSQAGKLEKDRLVCAGGSGDTLRLIGYEGDIEKWQRDTGTGWFDKMHTSDTLIYGAPVKDQRYRVMVGKSVCPTDTSNIVNISIIQTNRGGNIIPKIDSVCIGMNRDTLVLKNSLGNVKEWQLSDDDGFTWQPIANKDTFQIYNNLILDRKYRVLIESNGCMPAFSDTATVVVVDEPTGGDVDRDKSICGGTNRDTLVLKNYTGKIVKWQSDNGSGWTNINRQKDTLIVVSVWKTTSYRAIVGNDFCGNDTSGTATLTVISTTYGGEIHKSDSVCKDMNQGTLVLRNHIGDIRWWEKSTDRGVNWMPLANNDTIQGYVDVNTTSWYRVLVEGRNCPNDYSDTAVLTTYLPIVKITSSGSTSFCLGDSVMLSANEGLNRYEWNRGDTTRSITVSQGGMCKVVGTDNRGCSNRDSIKITVHALPVADAGEDQTISLGSTTQLHGKGGEVYLWRPGANLNDSTLAEPFATPYLTTLYTLHVVDINGCSDTDSVRITVNKDYNLSGKNLITPNGDGFNDVWVVDNVLPYTEAELTIINRYGYVVYASKGYENQWDGRSGDNVVPDGTYYYVITFPENSKVVKGHITVLSK